MMSHPDERTIELFKEEMKFSAGHFAIFSAQERERLHGHNFGVYAALTGRIDENGLLFDYRPYKQRIINMCREWNEYFLLPGKSPYLKVTEDGVHLYAAFADEKIPFLRSDVLVLPVRNVSLEELSRLFAESLRTMAISQSDRITKVEAKVSSGPGQFATCTRTTEAASK